MALNIVFDNSDFENFQITPNSPSVTYISTNSDFLGDASASFGSHTTSQVSLSVIGTLKAASLAKIPVSILVVASAKLSATHNMNAGSDLGTFYGETYAPWDYQLASHSGTHNTDLGPTTRSTIGTALYWGWIWIAYGFGPGPTNTNSVSAFTLTIEYYSSLTPTTGGTLGNDTVHITGGGFDGSTTVTFDGTSATSIVIIDGANLTCVIPAHAAGLINVVVTDANSSSVTLTFTYLVAQTAPAVDAGESKNVLGPPPRTITTVATVTRGQNNGTLTYAWVQLDGPDTPSISSPTALNTDIVFSTYTPGTYTFQLTVTTEPLNSQTLQAFDTVAYVIAPTVPPQVSSGSTQVTLPTDTTTLTPDITDDGWGGALSYAWTFVSGPGTPTIASPTAASTLITFPHTYGTYIFTLTTSRASDALTGVGTWRVTLYTGQVLPTTSNVGPVTMTVNGSSALNAIVDSFSIEERDRVSFQCSFSSYGVPIAVWDEIIITRGSIRLFGGICLSVTVANVENKFIHQLGLIGYYWHLTRHRVTKVYTAISISSIAADLLSLAPGGLSGSGIAAGMPAATISFTDVSIDEALVQLARLVQPRAHVFVDYYKVLHFAIMETTTDPQALTLIHPSLRNFSLSKDVSQTINRVIVYFDSIKDLPALVDANIEVPSLDGYNLSGGDAIINGNKIHYTGIKTKQVTWYNRLYLDVEITEIQDPNGTFAAGDAFPTIFITVQTPYGETYPIWGNGGGGVFSGSNNAEKIRLLTRPQGVDPDGNLVTDAGVVGYNVYRANGNDFGKFIGQIPAAGGHVIDITKIYANIENFEVPFVWDTTAGEQVKSFLTGCSGTQTTHTPSQVVANDTAAQAALATKFGDDGVIEISVQGGSISSADATTLAQSYLNARNDIVVTVKGDVRDDLAHPGSTISVNFPTPVDYVGALKIQQVRIAGFQTNRPHFNTFTAAPELITIEDLLKHPPPIQSKV